jgi:hypothetical protein
MSKKRDLILPAALLLLVALAAVPLRAQSTLFYLEAQGVGGYSSAAGKFVYYSQEQMEAMQKPGLGFDFVQRFSGASGDFAVLAVQARLAWNGDGDKALEPQIFNAYLKFKLKPFDLWIGHERPSFGLSAVLDSHGLLLQPLAMRGYGFDRDWGIGLSRQTETGDLGLSLTTGSGMDLRFRGNYFLAGRIGRGILATDNLTAGLSFGYGELLDVIGVNFQSSKLTRTYMAALDLTWARDNIEHRFEMGGGDRGGFGSFAALYRFGLGLLEENRLKLEVQPSAVLDSGQARYELALGATYLLHADWTLRTMAAYDSFLKDFRVVFQIYFYKGISF